ncbi:hypothetical protein [Desulfosarcina ovata]|uniref:hypothetical protein n=1 Tax=Desulfosarcina ovata TaxID=83564 RepID=UPI0018DA16B9|nr:hypothetical protein [Desulfosarcina ovata]
MSSKNFIAQLLLILFGQIAKGKMDLLYRSMAPTVLVNRQCRAKYEGNNQQSQAKREIDLVSEALTVQHVFLGSAVAPVRGRVESFIGHFSVFNPVGSSSIARGGHL